MKIDKAILGKRKERVTNAINLLGQIEKETNLLFAQAVIIELKRYREELNK